MSTSRLCLVRPSTSAPVFIIGAALIVGAIGPAGAHAAPQAPKKTSTSTAAPSADTALKIVRKTHNVLGTEVIAIAAATGDVDARLTAATLNSAFNEMDRVAALVSTTGDGDIARINAQAGGAPVRVSPEVFELLLDAKRMAQNTNGAFDPTFAALAPFWRFDANDPPAPVLAPSSDGGVVTTPFVAGTLKGPPVVPSQALIKLARGLVDASTLHLDVPAKTAKLAEQGQRVSLNGLAKGYALGRAATLLEEKGVKDFILAAGGDLVVRGKKGAKKWTVGIQDPRGPGHFAAFVAAPGAVMTTGDYERYFLVDNKRMHHVIDPRTGAPAVGLRSVTIVARNAVVADAFSTAVFVLGAKDGMNLVERTKGVEAILVTDKNGLKISRGLKGAVQTRPPTDAP